MIDLERALMELDVEWPATPDLAAAVRVELERPAPARKPRRFTGWRRRLAVAAAAVLVVFGGTMAASPAARSTVLRWLGLEGVEIKREEPTATPRASSPLGESLDLGVPITVASARGQGALVPESLGEPDAAYLGPTVGGERPVALVYAPREGLPASQVTGVALIVQTFTGDMSEPMIEKGLSAGGTVERLTVAGRPAYWVSGEPHGFMYETRGGGDFVPQRLADHTLIVQVEDRLLRVEGPLERSRAVAIAESALQD